MRGPCPEGGHNPCRRVEDALNTSLQGTGPVPRCPRGCWAGSSCSSYICREVGGTVGPLCVGVQELLGATVGPLWGAAVGPLCVGVQESSMFSLKIPHGGFLISLCRTQLWPPTPQRQQGAPLVHHQLQTEVGAAPPSPVLGSREQSEGDTGAQSSCRQGVTWQLCIPVGAPWS